MAAATASGSGPLRPQVDLADRHAPVPGGLQHVSQEPWVVRRVAAHHPRLQHRGKAAAEQGGTTGRAGGLGDDAVGEPRAGSRQPIEMRGRADRVAVAGQRVGAQRSSATMSRMLVILDRPACHGSPSHRNVHDDRRPASSPRPSTDTASRTSSTCPTSCPPAILEMGKFGRDRHSAATARRRPPTWPTATRASRRGPSLVMGPVGRRRQPGRRSAGRVLGLLAGHRADRPRAPVPPAAPLLPGGRSRHAVRGRHQVQRLRARRPGCCPCTCGRRSAAR